jgi:dodecin
MQSPAAAEHPDAGTIIRCGGIAQLVEHTTENRGVPGSSPGLAIRRPPGFPRGLAKLAPPWECAEKHKSTGGDQMADSVYRVTEVIGVSSESWEQAARNAVETAGESVRELRIAEVVRQDVTIADGKIAEFRVRLGISFKYDKAG